MRFLAVSALWFAGTAALLWADAGVLIPSNAPQPDASILSLEEMSIDILVDHGTARVRTVQIYSNHRASVLEGEWLFALPEGATVSDFAVWDDLVRIPGVILERRRASEIYETLRAQAIDPGLLQMGERDAAEARRSAVFSAKVAPIPAWGTKRVEFEYHQRLAVDNLRSRLSIPLRPDAYQAQRAGRLRVRLELRSESALRDFRVASTAYAVEITRQDESRVEARWEGRDVTFSEDLSFEWLLDGGNGDSLEVLTYRSQGAGAPDPVTPPEENPDEQPGYFLASALFALPAVEVEPPSAGPGPPAPVNAGPGQHLAILFDTSLSMQWEKLDRGYEALESLLYALGPEDRFELLLFDSQPRAYAGTASAGGRENVAPALEFVRSQGIRGGTNLRAALGAALDRLSQAGDSREPYLALISDGGATQGPVSNARLAEWYEQRLGALASAQRPRSYVFAVGDDANLPLLRRLTRENGLLTWVRSTEPVSFKLNAFLSKIGRDPIAGLTLDVEPAAAVDLVYPLDSAVFPGSAASWAGRYHAPPRPARFRVTGEKAGARVRLEKQTELPEAAEEHEFLPRTWARARVDALLEKIDREGEDEASIEEIIRLAKKFKFVTPYTSFLAAPRSLLRPRVIRPGDPILRVKTDPSIVSVTALFPFGLTKRLRYLDGEDIWQTRFLAPKDTPDGEHAVRLVLRDRDGRVYRENKTFLVASQPPAVRARLGRTRFRRGETIELRASASKTTRTLVARLSGVAPAHLRWNAREGLNTGRLALPADLPPGEYSLVLTAEDFAHNVGVEEVRIEITP